LKLESKAPEIWQERGEQNFKASHFQESVADFDRVLELAPAQAPHHWQRGISLYYAGRFADGRKQFESHQTVNPNDVENAAWHFLCAARESSVTNARAVMVKAGRDGRVPMREIDALYRGTGTVERVLEAATRGASEARGRDAMFYAHLYLGLYFEVLGDATRAREHIGKAAGEFSSEHYMGDVARVHLRRLNARP
jgi:lipoprotein NlpI